MTITTEDRIYTVEELKDLQGKLNLVVGEKQKKVGKSHIDHFIQVIIGEVDNNFSLSNISVSDKSWKDNQREQSSYGYLKV